MGQCHTNDRLEKTDFKTICTDFAHCSTSFKGAGLFSFHLTKGKNLWKQITYANICHVSANFRMFIFPIPWMKSIHLKYLEFVDEISFQIFHQQLNSSDWLRLIKWWSSNLPTFRWNEINVVKKNEANNLWITRYDSFAIYSVVSFPKKIKHTHCLCRWNVNVYFRSVSHFCRFTIEIECTDL